MLDNDSKLLETICLMLLPYHRLIKNWENLAYELNAPAALRTRLKRQTHHSQTNELFYTLSVVKKELKVQELIKVLRDLGRRDVAEMLITKVPSKSIF